MSREEIVEAALKLPHKERAEVASRLLESLDELSEAEWEEVWAKEAERRLKDLREGRAREIPGDEFVARLRSRYA